MHVVSEEPRVRLLATLEGQFGELAVANTHLSFIPGCNVLQLRRPRKCFAAVDAPLVLMGDLNLPDERPTEITGYRPLGRHPTFPAADPVRQLDHVLARDPLPDVTCVEARELGVSDHRALLVDL